MLQVPSDITQMARKGVTSFHLSVERWSNPMVLTSTENYDKFRTGWDIIIDIDSKLGIDEAKAAALLICRTLEKYNIKNYGLKFSGSRGFHIGLPWTMFPKSVDYKNTALLYPEIPRIVARFLRRKINHELMDTLIKSKGAKQLMEMMGEVPEKLSPYFFVDVEKDWGNRHMFRAPFSLNEKTWLASVTLSYNQMKNFDMKIADPKYVVANTNIYEDFLKGEENEAQDLLVEAMDWHTSIKKEEKKKETKKVISWEGKVTEENFPPCIKNILTGLQDGRKRSIFTLVNFLKMMNWQWQEIEEKVFAWNDKNRPPLPRTIVLGQLRWSEKNNRTTANCPPDGDLFYGDTVNVCRPDRICTAGTDKIMIKNPLVYPFKLMKVVRKKKTYRGYSCGICSKEFKNMRSLAVHKSRTHDVIE
jgi:DNA primase large subunit